MIFPFDEFKISLVHSKFEVLKRTRKIAESAFEKILGEVLTSKDKISEENFAERFLSEISKSNHIFPQGWYQPPPNGLGVLFATDENPQRLTFKTLRSEDWWPKGNVYLDKEKGLVVFYFSPVDRQTGLIGDFGKTIYIGNNSQFISQIEKTKNLVDQIFSLAQVGMTISGLYQKAENLFSNSGMINDWWVSVSDPTKINMGHTIPGINEEFSEEEKKVFGSDNWQDACDFISKKRIFFNSEEQTKIEPPFALTIEPRLKDKNAPQIPPIYFHTIALFHKDGTKEHLKPYQ